MGVTVNLGPPGVSSATIAPDIHCMEGTGALGRCERGPQSHTVSPAGSCPEWIVTDHPKRPRGGDQLVSVSLTLFLCFHTSIQRNDHRLTLAHVFLVSNLSKAPKCSALSLALKALQCLVSSPLHPLLKPCHNCGSLNASPDLCPSTPSV